MKSVCLFLNVNEMNKYLYIFHLLLSKRNRWKKNRCINIPKWNHYFIVAVGTRQCAVYGDACICASKLTPSSSLCIFRQRNVFCASHFSFRVWLSVKIEFSLVCNNMFVSRHIGEIYLILFFRRFLLYVHETHLKMFRRRKKIYKFSYIDTCLFKHVQKYIYQFN